MRRLVAAIVIAVVATAGVVVPTTAASANDDALTLPGGGPTVTLGANAVLHIDGRLRFTTACEGVGGINDWGYAASDIYLVTEQPDQGDELVDVGGTPSTVLQPGSMFIEEIVAITAPSGTADEGTYSLVYDSCQDGRFQADQDAVFAESVIVSFPAELPPVDATLRALKANAHSEWGRWQQIGKLFDSLINVDSIAGCAEADAGACLDLVQIWADSPQVKDWAETVGDLLQQDGCVGGDPGDCFGLLAEYWGFDGDSIRDRLFGGVKSLIANQAKSFFGLYADPPRDDYATPTGATIDYPVPVVQGAGAILDAVSAAGASLQADIALRTALVTALERYQGAQGAGDAAAAVSQLRSAASLATALAESDAAGDMQAVFDAADATIPALDALTQQRFGKVGLQGTQGFTPEEDRALRNVGIGAGLRGDYLASQRDAWSGSGYTAIMMNLAPVADAAAAQAAEAADLRDAAAQWASLADEIAADAGGAGAAVPTLTVTPTATGAVGDALTLTADASAGADVTWDLDGDGGFDDATGLAARPVYHLAGERLVAVRAVRGDAAVTAHALVGVVQTNQPPVIDSATPADAEGRPAAAGTVGASTTFTVTAHDPTGEQLRYAWYVDGVQVAGETGPSMTRVAAESDRGARDVSVTVQDPHPGNVAQHVWRWRVTDPDADGDGWAANAVADCDDGHADVHPRRLEALFNGADDDCDASTPDGGTDLGEGGQLWAWGSYIANPNGGGDTPAPYAGQAGDIVEIGAGFRGAYWLTRSGELYGVGMLGNGTAAVGPGNHVFDIGSASGRLDGIAAVTNVDGAGYARTADGHVVSWGDEINSGSLGAGIALWGRNHPDYVLGPDTDGDGHPDPLTDVVDLWQFGGAGLARTADGTLYQWGARQCSDAGWGYRPVVVTAVAEPVATMPAGNAEQWRRVARLLVQADGSSNNPGSAIFRLADGSVVACGAERSAWPEYTFNRLLPFGDFGPDNPAVDVDTNGNEWWVVTADGSAWVKTWDGTVNSMPGCTPALCPGGVLHEVPLPDDWHVVDVEAGADHYLRLADGRLVTFSGENTFGSLGHPVPDNPAPAAAPTVLNIDGFVLQASPTTWNGYALVLPSSTIAAAGWVAPQPGVRVSAEGGAGPEGGAAAAAIVLDRPASGDLDVSWRVGDESGTTTVGAGLTRAEVTLPLPASDRVWGADRHVSFVITGVSSNATLGEEIADVVVTDTDPAPTVSLAPVELDEGDAAVVAGTISLAISGPSAVDLPFTITSHDGTAVAGIDYEKVDVEVVVPAGQTSATAPIVLRGNATAQPDRTLALQAASADPAMATASSSLAILDDDPVVLRASASAAPAGEPAEVRLEVGSLPDGESVQVAWATRDATATAPGDYTAASGTVTLTAPGAGTGARLLADAAAVATIPIETIAQLASGADAASRVFTVDITAASATRGVLGPSSVPVQIILAAAEPGGEQPGGEHPGGEEPGPSPGSSAPTEAGADADPAAASAVDLAGTGGDATRILVAGILMLVLFAGGATLIAAERRRRAD